MYLHCCETYLVCSVYGVVIKWNVRNDKNCLIIAPTRWNATKHGPSKMGIHIC